MNHDVVNSLIVGNVTPVLTVLKNIILVYFSKNGIYFILKINSY